MTAKLLIVAGLTLCISAIADAQPYRPGVGQAPGAVRQAQQPGPVSLLKTGLKRLIAFAGQEQQPSEREIAAFLDHEIAPYFDFSYMARWAGGKMWRGMSPDQRRNFESRLQRMFLGTLAERLTSYGGQQVKVMRARRGRPNEVIVGVAVINPRGYPARLDFRFYRSSEGWKVFDVSANGTSAVMHYRKHFNRMARPGHGGRYGYPASR